MKAVRRPRRRSPEGVPWSMMCKVTFSSYPHVHSDWWSVSYGCQYFVTLPRDLATKCLPPNNRQRQHF